MKHVAFAAAATLAIAAGAHADILGTITADNHYALFGDSGGEIFFVGANEQGSGGDPGRYNWSQAETWLFDSSDSIYIAAWSDDRVAQGLLAEFDTGRDWIRTGDPGWEVFTTGIDLDDGSPPPTAAQITEQIALADAGGLWQTPHVGPDNDRHTRPWGRIDGISDEANWIWADAEGVSDPLRTGGDFGEFLIFRTAVPAPGPIALLASAAGLTLIRRRH